MDQLEAAAGVNDTFKVRIKGAWRWKCNQCSKHYSTKYSLMTHRVGHTGIKPFVCLDCGKAFKQLSHLNTHQLRHAGLRPHCCKVCGKTFTQSSHLKRHMNTHNPEGALYCDLCPRKFTYPSEVRAHKVKMHGPNKSKKASKVLKEKKHLKQNKVLPTGHIDLNEMGKVNKIGLENGSKPPQTSPKTRVKRNSPSQSKEADTSNHWQCNQCPKTFPTQYELITHMAAPAHQNSNLQKTDSNDMVVDDTCATMVEGVRRWQCKKCSKTYATKYGLMTHMVDHMGTKPFECKDCGKRFKQLSHLNTHRLRHQGLRPHACNICGKTFVQASHLKRHKHTHTTEGAYFCDLCPRKFTYPSELRSHKEKIHTPGKSNGLETSVRKHVAVVKGQKDPKSNGTSVILCPECGKSFHYQSQLDKHMKRHTNNRPNICKECGMQFMEVHHLTQHEFTHTGIKPHRCPVCSRGFALEANMRRHLLIHSGVRNFECHLCRRRFAQKQTLRAHMIIHSDTKPHVCKFCGKAFRRNRNLLCHLRLHTDSKPFKCLSCGLRFNRKGNLKKHQKEKHDLDARFDFAHFSALKVNDEMLLNSLQERHDLHDVIPDNEDNVTKESSLLEDIKHEVCSPEETHEHEMLLNSLQERYDLHDVIPEDEDNDKKESSLLEDVVKHEVISSLEEACEQAESQDVVDNDARSESLDFPKLEDIDIGDCSNSKLENHPEHEVVLARDVNEPRERPTQFKDDLLQQDVNSVNDNFVFHGDPINDDGTIFDENIQWEDNLGEDFESEDSPPDKEIQCDNILNKPRAIISKYFMKTCDDTAKFETRNGESDVEESLSSTDAVVPEAEIRMSRRKGLPRKLDQSKDPTSQETGRSRQSLVESAPFSKTLK